jgi:mRNA interferase MazF
VSRRIVLAQMPEGKTRPVLVLTREAVQPHLNALTVAPITSRIRGLRTEVPIGPRNGLDHESVVNLDNITTVPVSLLGQPVGLLFEDQEEALAEALIAAFDLEV